MQRKTDPEWIKFLLRGPMDKVLPAVKAMPLADYVRISRGMDKLIEEVKKS